MLPSFVTKLPGGQEQGTFYALDLVRERRERTIQDERG